MIAVIGGGITGLTIADYLNQMGEDVDIYEASSELGGQCKSINLDGLILDRFYHVFFPDDIHVWGLIKKLEMENMIGYTKSSSGVYIENGIFPVNDLMDMIKLPQLTLIEKVRLGWTLLKAIYFSNFKEMEATTAEKWLIKSGGIGAYTKFWKPMLKNKFREGIKNLSAIDIWARINRYNSFKRAKTGKNIHSGKMCYIKGKVSKIIDKYERYLLAKGVRVYKNTKITGVKNLSNNQTVLEMDENEKRYDKIFFTTVTPIFSRLVPQAYNEYKKYIATLNYIGNISMILITRKPLMKHYMLAIEKKNMTLTAVIGGSNLYSEEEMQGKNVYYVSSYFLNDLRLYNEKDEYIYNYFLQELNIIFPGIENQILSHKINRVRYTEPFYCLGYNPPAFETPISNVYLVSGSQIYPYTPVMNSSIGLATKAINEIYSAKK